MPSRLICKNKIQVGEITKTTNLQYLQRCNRILLDKRSLLDSERFQYHLGNAYQQDRSYFVNWYQEKQLRRNNNQPDRVGIQQDQCPGKQIRFP